MAMKVIIALMFVFGVANSFWLYFPSNSGKQGTCPTVIITFPCIKCTADNQCSGNLLCCPSPINQTGSNQNLCCTPASLGGK
ncbi:hypothetical protein CHUAL_001962 [Chamberlinius hualienensis]